MFAPLPPDAPSENNRRRRFRLRSVYLSENLKPRNWRRHLIAATRARYSSIWSSRRRTSRPSLGAARHGYRLRASNDARRACHCPADRTARQGDRGDARCRRRTDTGPAERNQLLRTRQQFRRASGSRRGRFSASVVPRYTVPAAAQRWGCGTRIRPACCGGDLHTPRSPSFRQIRSQHLLRRQAEQASLPISSRVSGEY